MSWKPVDARLPIPGTHKKMGVAEVASFFDLEARLFDECPLLVAYGGKDVRCLYDERGVERLFHERWPDIQPILDEVRAENPYTRLRELLQAETRLSQDATELRDHVEASVIESMRDGKPVPTGVVAALILIVLELELSRALER